MESIFGWVASAAAFVVEMIEAIPVIGAFIRWFRNGVTLLVWTVLSIPDLALGIAGIRPEKKLRVCTVILLDENGARIAEPDYAVALLQLAADIYKRDANVRIVPSRPFQYSTGFLGAETVTEDWVQIDGSASDADLLDPPCNAAGAAADWWLGGTKFQWKMSTFCFFGAWRRTSGYGAPVACFIVRAVPEAGGCALWITDYAMINSGNIPPPNPSVIAHELGHASNLWHLCVDDDPTNLMASPRPCPLVPTTTTTTRPDGTTATLTIPSVTTTPIDFANPHMEDWQVLLVRASKHVTYF